MVKRLIAGAARKPGPTMQDIATRSGVSAATVSYVLNAKPGMRVSQATRQRVLQIAEQLQYRPNAIARAMVSGRSHTVGVYQPHAPGAPMSGMWASDVLRGIGETLHNHGYHLLLYGYRESEGPSPSAFLDGRNDGLIILAPHAGDTLLEALAAKGYPVAVIAGPRLEGSCAFSVDTDHVRGGALAVEHLVSVGHRKIALMEGPANVPNAIDRRRGYERAMAANQLDVRPHWIVTSGFSLAGGRRALQELWSGPDRPTAVCAANDVAALGALEVCAELGIRVPDDLAIIGYDDSSVCSLTQPPLTSVRQPARHMGAAAAERVIDALSGRTNPEMVLFEPVVTIRKSCGA